MGAISAGLGGVGDASLELSVELSLLVRAGDGFCAVVVVTLVCGV